MQLAQAEPVGILNHHQGRVGHVHPHLDDRSCYHHIRFAPGKGSHGGFLLRALHLPVEQSNPQIGKNRLLKGFRPGGGCLDPQLLIFLHRRADHKTLVAFPDLLADKGVDAGAVALPHKECVHRFSAGGQLV